MPALPAVLEGRNIRLLLEYDGTNFAGWQIQRRDRTVQGELARALRVFLREPICPIGSGRTDAGVHAAGQVAHFHTSSEEPVERILAALNGLLPSDIAVLEVEEADRDFHARYCAASKRYRYRISCAKAALDRTRVWTIYRRLDFDAILQASRLLPGTHSFEAFCKQAPPPDNFLCHITHCAWQRRGRELVFEIEANRFLRHMVRILVGTLVEIGAGRRPPGSLSTLLDGADRGQAGPTAPPHGLCLLRVSYP